MTETLPYRWYTDSEVFESRARAAVRAHLAVRGSPRRARGTRLVLHAARRRRPAGRRARPRGRAARVRERLPPPRRRGGQWRRPLHHPAVSLPRLDLRPRRLAARGAALGERPRLRPRIARPAAGPGGHLGSVHLRQRRRRGSAARRDARHAARSLVRQAGLDVDSLVFHSRVPYSLDANWKIAVENYLECYHCAVAHPSFSDVIDVRRRGLPAGEPPHLRQPLRPSARDAPRRRTTTRAATSTGQFHMIWPSIKVNVMPGRENISTRSAGAG